MLIKPTQKDNRTHTRHMIIEEKFGQIFSLWFPKGYKRIKDYFAAPRTHLATLQPPLQTVKGNYAQNLKSNSFGASHRTQYCCSFFSRQCFSRNFCRQNWIPALPMPWWQILAVLFLEIWLNKSKLYSCFVSMGLVNVFN